MGARYNRGNSVQLLEKMKRNDHTMKADKKGLSKTEFDRDAAEYDHSPKYASLKSSYQKIAEEVLCRPFRTWLDVGCGTGSLLLLVNQQYREAKLCGVDLSEQMVSVARSKLGDKADLRVSDSEKLPFVEEQFDLVTCTFSFHHYPHPMAVLGEMKRVLAPTGRILIADPTLFFPIRQALNLVAPFSRDGMVRFYSRSEMGHLLDSVELTISSWSKLNWHSFLLVAKRT